MIFTATFKPAGTKTGRFASAAFLDIFGANAQNVPDEKRRLIVPRPGMRFIQNDYEGAESIIVALLVKDGNFRELVRLKIKAHNFVCVHLFPEKFADLGIIAGKVYSPAEFKSLPYYAEICKRCKKLKREYDLAKRTGHGSNYGMSWKTFQKTVLRETEGKVYLTAAECKRLLATYLVDLFPEIKEMQATVEDRVKQLLPITDLFGHSCVFYERFTAELARTAISWTPQRTVGVLSIRAACKLQDYIETNKRNWNVLNVVHDSILAEGPTAEADELAEVTAQCMHHEFTSPIDGWKISIGVEKSIGDNWGKYDEDENPRGMRVC